ncbi:MAG: DNA repair protein RadC [Oscillospiraceae bacterium]|nr:DNA repair protein RadC [Oscillospiraceae bacterium]
MNNPHSGHRKRLKERFVTEGLDSFSDLHALELMLFFVVPRRDTNPIAHGLLERFGSLRGVMDARKEDLEEVKGVGENATLLLKLIPALVRKYRMDSFEGDVVLLRTQETGDFLIPRFSSAREEEVHLLSLDAKGKVLDCRRIHKGSVNTVGVSVRKVVETALTTGASSVVLAHNHPSGLALPSEEDKATTRLVQQALKPVSVTLADHIIVAGEDFVSLRDDGFFD